MSRIRVSTVIDATPAEVWDSISDISTHVLWMHDARAIRFTSHRQSGVGTTFDCDTRIGPLRLTDAMEITSWRPRRRMGVRHVGVVTGRGAFTLKPSRRIGRADRRRGRGQRRRHRRRGPATRFTWKESLRFPWWLGGPFGALIGGAVLRLVWRRNLRTLRRLIEAGQLGR
jgi:hypothetical protein